MGQAFDLDGTGDSVTIPDDPSLYLNQFTIDAWIYPERFIDGGWQVIVAKGSRPDASSLWLFEARIQMWFHIEGIEDHPLQADGVRQLTLNTWHHVVATYDGASVKIYVDGVEDVAVARTGKPSSNSVPLRIGSSHTGFCFQRLIDEVEIFKGALTGDEIMALYNAGSAWKRKP